MLRVFLLTAFAASPALAEEAKFLPSAERFETAAACRTHLAGIVTAASAYEAAKGPYELEAGDVRIHLVRVEGNGHHIWEHRCLGTALSSRDWIHRMVEDEEDFTIESAVRKAEWLKKDIPQK